MPVTPVTDMYRGGVVALLTQHGKEAVVAPVLDAALGCRVRRVDGYDTDRLGTFTRDVGRPGTQIEAARRKARIGMELAATPLGVASEGSFGRDPYAGLLPWNIEMLLFVDDLRGIEVAGVAEGGARSAHCLGRNWEDVEAFARHAGFPGHHLVLRPDTETDGRIRKGIASWADLESACATAMAQSQNGSVFVEIDLRAHANPTRMATIRLAAEDLARRLASPCPACGLPGFWVVERIAGLPCGQCGAPTREVCAEIRGCIRCDCRIRQECADRSSADPAHCDVCNP